MLEKENELINDIEASIKHCACQVYCKQWWTQFLTCNIHSHKMEPIWAKCQSNFVPQFKENKAIKYCKMCETCRRIKTNLHVYCVKYDKFHKLITDLHESS